MRTRLWLVAIPCMRMSDGEKWEGVFVFQYLFRRVARRRSARLPLTSSYLLEYEMHQNVNVRIFDFSVNDTQSTPGSSHWKGADTQQSLQKRRDRRNQDDEIVLRRSVDRSKCVSKRPSIGKWKPSNCTEGKRRLPSNRAINTESQEVPPTGRY
jgi:hypothetical protein